MAMSLIDKLFQYFRQLRYARDDLAQNFMDREYLHMLQISGLYLNLDGNRCLYSLLQFTLYFTVLGYLWLLFFQTSLELVGISFVLLSQNVHLCLLTQLVMVIGFFIQFKRADIVTIHKSIAINFFDYGEPYEGVGAQLSEKMFKERKIMIVIPISVVLATAAVLTVSPVLDRFGDFDFNRTSHIANENLPLIFVKYPYYTKDGFGYYSSFVTQIMLGFIISSLISTGGFAYILISQNISLQMKVLLDSLENIEIRARNIISSNDKDILKLSSSEIFELREFKNCYKECLKKNFQHHQIILRNFQLWTEIFSLPVLVAYMTGTIVIALSLLSASSWSQLPGTTISSFVLCGAEIGYMYLFSDFSQRITDLNEELRFQIYSIKWYNCDEGIKKNLRIFQEMTRKPMTLIAGGIVPANMSTFSNVINSSYSYYNLANAFNVT